MTSAETASSATGTGARAVKSGVALREMPVCFIAPTLLLLVLVVAYPILYSFYVSFHQTEYLKIGQAVGLRHYITVLRDDAVRNNTLISVKYVVGSLLGAVPFGLLLAILLNRGLPLSGVFQTICILPWVISQTVAALLWNWFLDPSFGPVNYVLGVTGLGRLDFRADESIALLVLIGVNIWMSYPFAMILFLAGLQTIAGELYEAARIDGASAFQEFLYITLPLLANTFLATCIMLTLYYFTMVTLIFTLTNGGPLGVTEVLSLRVFHETFYNWRIGRASALGFVIFILNAVFSFTYVRVLQRESVV
jgi:multiple sugar transport system permease protein